MPILPIVKHPNDVLEKECQRVSVFDKKLKKLLDNMYETMLAADGVGLAAPQVGEAIQVCVVDVDDRHGRIDLVNPQIIDSRGEEEDLEGCLSFPGLYGYVKRNTYVKVRAQNARGKTFTIEATGFLARALQHEIDHLHGVLFTTKVTRYEEEGEESND
ncbi:MAG: peptide deformylase [Bacillaceae bacterium]